jgi:hypothetical protein
MISYSLSLSFALGFPLNEKMELQICVCRAGQNKDSA